MGKENKSSSGTSDREARLKQALKANLQRRKQQARARADGSQAVQAQDESGSGDSKGAVSDG